VCEYCGCQALSAIGELTREHDLVVNLIGDVRSAHSAGNVTGMARVAREIAAILGPHTQVEERGLFPALAADFPDHVDALNAEHRRIETVLAEAATGPPADPGGRTGQPRPVRLGGGRRRAGHGRQLPAGPSSPPGLGSWNRKESESWPTPETRHPPGWMTT
jgi:hypothetical protein